MTTRSNWFHILAASPNPYTVLLSFTSYYAYFSSGKISLVYSANASRSKCPFTNTLQRSKCSRLHCCGKNKRNINLKTKWWASGENVFSRLSTSPFPQITCSPFCLDTTTFSFFLCLSINFVRITPPSSGRPTMWKHFILCNVTLLFALLILIFPISFTCRFRYLRLIFCVGPWQCVYTDPFRWLLYARAVSSWS